jgi:hypothetical protein
VQRCRPIRGAAVSLYLTLAILPIIPLAVNVNPRIIGSMTLDQVLVLLRRECDKADGQAAWAKRHGISAAYVSDVLNRRREPGEGILRPLGLEKAVTYRRIKP